MQELLTEETPGKVLGLTGAALFSMALLFSVSLSNASFSGAEFAIPDPFSHSNVVSAIDSFAASYANGLLGFAAPARQAFAIHIEEMKWVMDEASWPLAKILGFEGVLDSQIAGAQTLSQQTFKVKGNSRGSLGIEDIYAMVLGN